jgi:hypothetical protein
MDCTARFVSVRCVDLLPLGFEIWRECVYIARRMRNTMPRLSCKTEAWCYWVQNPPILKSDDNSHRPLSSIRFS